MSTNDTDVEDQKVEDKPVTDADLAALKDKALEVEVSKDTDESEPETEEKEEKQEVAETEDEGQTESEEDTSEDKPEEVTFTKKFTNIKGDTPEEYARNIETAYDNSTTEALKWKKLYEDAMPTIKRAEAEAGSDGVSDIPIPPALQYAEQLMKNDMERDINEFAKRYPQIKDPDEYSKLEKRVGVFTKAIREEEGRVAPMSEVLQLSAVSLQWDQTNKKEELGMAVKDSAAASKAVSATKQTSRSKVTPDQIKAARAMNPFEYANKSDTEIASDLEPYI